MAPPACPSLLQPLDAAAIKLVKDIQHIPVEKGLDS